MKQKHRLEVSQGVVINVLIHASLALAFSLVCIAGAVHIFTGALIATPALFGLMLVGSSVAYFGLGIALGARLVTRSVQRERVAVDSDTDRSQLPPEGRSLAG